MNPKDKLEQYETTEAKDIIRLLKTLSPQEEEYAPPTFKSKVLIQLEEKRTHRNWFSGTFWYQISMSLAAGVVIGVSLSPLFLSQKIEKSPLDTQRGFRGPSGVSIPVEKQSPEAWLESIAELLVTGQISRANSQLEVFIKQYPNFEQNLVNP